ncbi:MAG TPA: putative zinc-binding metallopeptidase [Steroidobacteraceae bacterium]|nr:putative zinc-binding metallopeptidase [Steroidobacteraceae bacterium]
MNRRSAVKTFHCTHCQHLVFFENIRCLNCGHALAYLPDRNLMAAVQQSEDGLWRYEGPGGQDQAYRLCANYDCENVCNWAVPQGDAETLCRSCRLTHVIPDLSLPGNSAAWYRLEVAKRRLVYTLLGFGLPVAGKKAPNDSGVEFQFLEDSASGDGRRVLTGHDNGLITINVAEADDVRREQQRQLQNEQYRTLLGHFRHEIGHYYWDRLIQGSPRHEAFRQLFGDERADYQPALQKHYQNGPPPNWETNFISAYATAHPWEDWAESWAHLMHMTDALETAAAVGLSLKPKRPDEPSMTTPPNPLAPRAHNFDRMVEDWLPLTYVLNNLNRGLGLSDSYPFVLSPPVVEKLRFIHGTIYATG